MANLNGAFGIVLSIIILCYISTQVNSDFEFTNIECNLSDEFSKIETCFLKSINRTYKYASLKIQLLKPINKFWAHVIFMKLLTFINKLISFLFFVEKVPISYLNHKLTKVLPIPSGDYKIVSHWLMDNFRAMDVNVYFRI
ncbi:uncharacterized protein LOC133839981 [Drosophila sulfurigaster albostrigata]|uniref:uncharacterized protein LOC133839981 n=1 Tax=Drosophila sulfurigaster albostrigata TaxID=89887 RepID=UPI002D21EC76|nr:uncharacterized protein LOC133839981 [Drosophila sulfurigaster albostrigata]